MQKTALVLGAGGVFGAYQAGVWKALEDSFEPDLVVGASIGALNGWLIAGGCPGDELERLWLTAEEHRRIRLRIPVRLSQGCLDLSPAEGVFTELFKRFQPRVEYAAVVTDVLRRKPRILKGSEMTPKHLLASCAVPFAFDLQRLDGRLCADGGLVTALPVWAAVELGATRIVAVHPLPDPPGVLKLMRLAGRWRYWRYRNPDLSGATVIEIMPERPLGPFLGMLRYRRRDVEQWIGQGERDGSRMKAGLKRDLQNSSGVGW